MLSKHHLTASVGAALAVGALLAPAATASPVHSSVYARQDKQVVNSVPAARNVAPPAFSRQDKQVVSSPSGNTGGGLVVSSPRPTSPVAAPGGGFDWGDAGIGAAGGLVLSITALGGALAISRRRTDGTRRTAPVTS